MQSNGMSSVLELYASGRAMSGMSFFLSSWSIKTVILFWLFWKWVPRLDGFCSGAMVLAFYSKWIYLYYQG